MKNTKKIIGYILGVVALLMLFGQARVVGPILGLGFTISIFHITVQAVILIIASYHLIK